MVVTKPPEMKTILGVLIASVLSVYTFGATCWYRPSSIFNFSISILTGAIFVYVIFLVIYIDFIKNIN